MESRKIITKLIIEGPTDASLCLYAYPNYSDTYRMHCPSGVIKTVSIQGEELRVVLDKNEAPEPVEKPMVRVRGSSSRPVLYTVGENVYVGNWNPGWSLSVNDQDVTLTVRSAVARLPVSHHTSSRLGGVVASGVRFGDSGPNYYSDDEGSYVTKWDPSSSFFVNDRNVREALVAALGSPENASVPEELSSSDRGTHVFDDDVSLWFQEVSVSGPSVDVPQSVVSHEGHLNVVNLGSGRVIVSAYALQKFSAVAKGSGDITSTNGCLCRYSDLEVRGRGSIKGFVCQEKVSARTLVASSGCIAVSKDKSCITSCNSLGPGGIAITNRS